MDSECYLLLKEVNIHFNLICFDRNFDQPHINVVTFVPRKQSKKPQFFHKNVAYFLSRREFLKNCYSIVAPLKI